MASAILCTYESTEQARAATKELLDRGFAVEQIGIAGPDWRDETVIGSKTCTNEGAVAGATGGAGLATLWGLGIAFGALPAIGPAIIGGTLAAMLTSAGVGATAGTFVGALIGMGIPKDDADRYAVAIDRGQTVLAVTAGHRDSEARDVLSKHGGRISGSADAAI